MLFTEQMHSFVIITVVEVPVTRLPAVEILLITQLNQSNKQTNKQTNIHTNQSINKISKGSPGQQALHKALEDTV